MARCKSRGIQETQRGHLSSPESTQDTQREDSEKIPASEAEGERKQTLGLVVAEPPSGPGRSQRQGH